MTIYTGATHNGSIYFSDATSGNGQYDGYIEYNHSQRALYAFGGVNMGYKLDGANRVISFHDGGSERMRIDSSGNVGIGVVPETTWHSSRYALQLGLGASIFGDTTASGCQISANTVSTLGSSLNGYKYINSDKASTYQQYDGQHNFRVASSGSADGAITWNTALTINNSGNVGIGTSSPTAVGSYRVLELNGTAGGYLSFEANGNKNAAIYTGTGAMGFETFNGLPIQIITGGAERMRIHSSSGYVTIGKTTSAFSTAGTAFYPSGEVNFVLDNNPVVYINRLSTDGNLVNFYQAGSLDGSISTSSGTVSYNAFSGSHWSRLSDNSKPTILKGTVIETIDEMCDWYEAQFTVAKTEENEEYIQKVSIALPDGKSVGDTISYTYEGITYDNAVIVKESDNKHTKCKISDTADSKKVYGVFFSWDDDDNGDDGDVNDMFIDAGMKYRKPILMVLLFLLL